MSISIVSAWGWATNPAYDSDTANNGGCHWRYVDGTMDDASIDAPEEVEDILASASGVLGVDAFALVCEAREAADLCARQEVG